MPSLAEDITVVVTSSVIPSHPSTEVLDACLANVRGYLPDSPIFVLCDGIREEMEHRADDYKRYVHAARADALDKRWGVCTVIEWVEHQHQARMVRHALHNLVQTPLVLLVEHDTTLYGTIDFDSLANVLHSRHAQIIRFHHEARVLVPHQWMNVNGGKVERVQGVPLIATVQYSARPHLADVDWYRMVLGPDYMHPDARGFVEDQLWGRIVRDWQDEGRAGWQKHGLWIYAEPDEHGSIKHSETCDGRGDDPKAPTETLPLEGLA